MPQTGKWFNFLSCFMVLSANHTTFFKFQTLSLTYTQKKNAFKQTVTTFKETLKKKSDTFKKRG